MTKNELKEYLSQQIDLMDDAELLELSDFLQNRSSDETIAEELLIIKGEFKKLTKLVTKIEVDFNTQALKSTKSDLKPFIQFHKFIVNSKEALNSMPKNSLFSYSEFNKAFGAFENGFRTIDTLYKDILESLHVTPSAKKGDKFDSNIHEVVEVMEDRNIEDGVVVEVFEEGFLYKNELVNYAKVKVNRWM